MKKVIIDVREPDEYQAEHIAESISIPLSKFVHLAPGVLSKVAESEILIMCRSGARAKSAASQISGLGFKNLKFEVFEGGILKWKEMGNPTVVKKRGHVSLMRQVQIIVGFSSLLGLGLGLTINPGFFAMPVFFTGGLLWAGISGRCLLAEILVFAPWNKGDGKISEELCGASPTEKNCCD